MASSPHSKSKDSDDVITISRSTYLKDVKQYLKQSSNGQQVVVVDDNDREKVRLVLGKGRRLFEPPAHDILDDDEDDWLT